MDTLTYCPNCYFEPSKSANPIIGCDECGELFDVDKWNHTISEWISVDDQKPEPLKYVLVNPSNEYRYRVGFYSDKEPGWSTLVPSHPQDMNKEIKVTHWQEIP